MSTSPRSRPVAAIVAAAFAAVLSVDCVSPAAAQSIAVVVNGQPILTSEVQARAALFKLSGGKEAPSAQEDLINEKLKLAEAKRYGMTPDDAQVEAAFAQIAQRTKLTTEQFTKAIGQRGVTAQTLKGRLAAEIVWAQLVRRKFANQLASRDAAASITGGVKVDNKAVQYTLRQVVFVLPKGANDKQVQQRRAEAIAARGRFPGCAQAVQFASALRDVAVKEPVIRSSGTFGKDFNDLISKTKVGGLTEPQRSEDGVEMIAVCERTDIADDSILKQQALNDSGGKELEEKAKNYLAQLRSKAVVEVRR